MRSIQFHQGFALERQLIKGLLQFITRGESASDEAVGAYLGVNPYKVQGVRGWFCKLGLGSGTSKQYRLSAFGKLVADHDPELARMGTLWLLHYFLASEHEERAEVWYQCFNAFLQPGRRFTREELQGHVELNVSESPANQAGVEKDAKELVKAYKQPTALGGLGLITQQPDKQLVAGLSKAPEVPIVGYIVFDMWQRRYPDSNTIRLSQLVAEPETPGKIFVATSAQVREMVLHLQTQGLLSYSDTQHEPVTRRFHDAPITLLEHYYQRS